MARRLRESDAQAAELHGLESALVSLRKLPVEALRPPVTPHAPLVEPPWSLEASEREVLKHLRTSASFREVCSAEQGIPPEEVDRRVIGCLRKVAGIGESQPSDRLIGAFLLEDGKAPPSHQLWAAGVDPLDLHQIELAFNAVRAMPRRRWASATAPSMPTTEIMPLSAAKHGA
jgi:hypothetical protein